MANLKTDFVGLTLKSPIIAGSSGLTADMNELVDIEKSGAGAVVLKSIFEEQIIMETERTIEFSDFPTQEDYIREYVKANNLQQYIELIKEAKSRLTIPVIASINCVKDGEWLDYAAKIEAAGADALELNIFTLNLDEFKESKEIEEEYFNILRHLKKVVNIPLVIKISNQFTNLTAFVSKLHALGASAVTLFNRFYEPDIDIRTLRVESASVFSMPEDLRIPLRWTGILSAKEPKLQISASTGVHDGGAVVKMLLAGATTVQVCSAMYENGISVIEFMNKFLNDWMEKQSFNTISEFRGKLSYSSINNAVRYERAQFMKYFSSRK
ncbi:MAG: dihydroorotate dehydrogenase-like protein [Culturomica sp.]|jgi:dihydroorotate dehydrogenase (fumarate)|nr:dihydroorotate dehydrogenase-like protein [Culturomica sp.]